MYKELFAIQDLFASKNRRGSLLWNNYVIRHVGRYDALNFVDYVKEEMTSFTCQSKKDFKNPDVMTLDNCIPTAYTCLNNIYKKNYKVTPEFYKTAQYFVFNTTLVTLSSYCQASLNGVLIIPAFPIVLAKYCNDTVMLNNIVFKQWTHSNLLLKEEEVKFKRIVDSFLNEKNYREELTHLLAMFPLASNTVYPTVIWKLINTNDNISLKIRTSLAISWFAEHNIFYEPSADFLGITSEGVNITNLFHDDIPKIETFNLKEVSLL